MATLTFDYAESTAVLGMLANQPEPGTYDLCARHAEATSVPRGWSVIRLPQEPARRDEETVDDELLALANAVREIGLRHDSGPPEPVHPEPPIQEGVRAGHLRLIIDE